MMSAGRRRLRLRVSTVTGRGSTKVPVTATIRRVIDMTDREALKLLMGLTDEEIDDLGGFEDEECVPYPILDNS